MKSFGATAVCALALCGLPAAASAQQTPAQRVAVDETPNTLRHLETPDPARGAARRPVPRYFIEFRSRSALSYGHTFVVFGRVGERLTARNVAGLHPRGDSSITYMIGHIVPVPSETGASDGDLEEQYTTARYRIALSAAEYRTIVAHIRELQATSPAWNAATYNCNAFAGTIAHFVGLTSPPPWLLPEDFVNSMRRMNGERRRVALPRPGGAAGPWTSEARAAGNAMARQFPGRR